MGRVKELLLEQQYESEATPEEWAAVAEMLKAQTRETEERLVREREWAAQYPHEWSQWLRITPLLGFSIDFGSDRGYDFPRFLADVGPAPSAHHSIRRRDKSLPYQEGNLVWVKPTRPADSPYLTTEEAAAYCRCKPKTISNHKSLGNIRSMPGTRPPLFRREDLDAWVSSRRRARRK